MSSHNRNQTHSGGPLPDAPGKIGKSSAIDTGLEESVALLEEAAVFGGMLVLTGLALEIALLIWPVSNERLALVIANVFITLGVGAEVLFGKMASRRQGKLLKRSNDKLAKVVKENSELQERLQPRHINQEAGDRIVEKIEGFAGTSYDVLLDPVAEPIFRDSITHVLSFGGGWKWMKRPGSGTEFMSVGVLPGMAGMQIRVNKSRLAELEPAAKALAAALTAEGFTTHIAVEYPDAPNPDALHIVIGRKP